MSLLGHNDLGIVSNGERNIIDIMVEAGVNNIELFINNRARRFANQYGDKIAHTHTQSRSKGRFGSWKDFRTAAILQDTHAHVRERERISRSIPRTFDKLLENGDTRRQDRNESTPQSAEQNCRRSAALRYAPDRERCRYMSRSARERDGKIIIQLTLSRLNV